MTAPRSALKQRPVVYVTRDIERALGLPAGCQNYFILTNYTPFGKRIATARQNVSLVRGQRVLDTRELLAHPAAARLMSGLPRAGIMVFKNTPAIERLCAERGWKLMNPSAQLGAAIEEKISQVKLLGPLRRLFPSHRVEILNAVRYDGKQFIMQFNRAHTGSGTILVNSARALQEWQRRFPRRPVRITDYIPGPMFTNNNVVWGQQVLVGNINYQITGLAPFTERPFATVGNDWALPAQLLTAREREKFANLARAVGKKLARLGWKGLYGIDVVLDEKTRQLYLIEINARQPASATYESLLQERARPGGQKKQLTTVEAHLRALWGEPYRAEQLAPIRDGAQIVQKLTDTQKKLNPKKSQAIISRLQKNNFEVIVYSNSEIESDWLRIQSHTGIMERHNTFNARGREIIENITT